MKKVWAALLVAVSMMAGSTAWAAPQAGEMELEVDIESGSISLLGNSVNSSGFSISSASGSLTPDLSNSPAPFQGYLSNTTSLASAFSFTGVPIDGVFSLGIGYDTQGTQDLVFGYGIAGQAGEVSGIVAYIPEPASLVLIGLGGLALATRRRRA